MPWALEFLGWARIPAVIVLFPNQARGKSTITAGITQYMAAGTQFGVGMKLAGTLSEVADHISQTLAP